ncbi:MAG: hypothetical protein ACREDV_07055, partial [Methylocella sp.]
SCTNCGWRQESGSGRDWFSLVTAAATWWRLHAGVRVQKDMLRPRYSLHSTARMIGETGSALSMMRSTGLAGASVGSRH